MNKFILVLFLNTLFFLNISASSSVQIENLRTEYLHNPIGIDVEHPQFSWEISSNMRNVTQMAYEIIVSIDEAGQNTIWKSGKIVSGNTLHVKYTGRSLSASTRYYWHVIVWTNKMKACSTEKAFFETGLLNTGWGNAHWIKGIKREPLFKIDLLPIRNKFGEILFFIGIAFFCILFLCNIRKLLLHVKKRTLLAGCFVSLILLGALSPKIISVLNNRCKPYLPRIDKPLEKGFMFRKEFTLNKEIKSAKLYTSSLGIYDLFINEKRVGTPTENGKMSYDELKPGWTDYNKTVQYLTYDVTSLLQSGENAICSEVTSGWWAGEVSYGEYGVSPELGFIAKLVLRYADGSTESVVTDSSWHSSTNGALRMGDIYHGEIYDARKESNWKNVIFDDSKWDKVSINKSFRGKIKAFEGPQVRVRSEFTKYPISATLYKGKNKNGSHFGEINVLEVKKKDSIMPVILKKGETVIFDLGQNMVGWIKFTVNGQRGATMKVRFGEMLNDTGQRKRGNDGAKGALYTANLRGARASLHYTLKGEGSETFHPSFTFFGFRYCEITATKDITIESLEGQVVGSVTKELGSFETNSPIVNQLYSNIIWGQRGNYLSVPSDCPQRDERLGWTGDTQIFSKAAAYNADVAAFFHKWMTDMIDSQRADGAYPDTAPHVWVGWGNAGWAEAGIIVPWNMYLIYGDWSILEQGYESMEKYMQFLASRADTRYKYNGADTTYGDWLSYEKTDSRYIAVCYYAYAAELMSKISEILSQQTGENKYKKNKIEYKNLYNNIKTEFQHRYIKGDGSLKETSQTAYLLTLKLKLFPSKKFEEKGVNYLIKKIVANGNRLSTGFIGTGILNQTLSRFGANETAYNLLLQRANPSWLYSIDQGATTIWERWDSYTLEKGFNDVSMNSFNHYAYGAISEWMFRYMAGIEADAYKPAFKHIILQPSPDTRTDLPHDQERITWVKASYHSYSGMIKSAWKMKEDSRLGYTASVPANTTARLYLPVVNNRDKIYEGSHPAPKSEGVSFLGIKNNKAIFNLKSGDYKFDVRK